jgi:hypothetical protein
VFERRATAVAVAAVLSVGIVLALDLDAANSPPPTPSTPTSWTPTTHAPPSTIAMEFTAEELGFEVDQDGRPFDDKTFGHVVELEELGTLHVTDGRLRVLDGISIIIGPSPFEGELVDFSPHEELDLSVLWAHDDSGNRGVIGVRVDVRGTRVERWQPFEDAYGTDGGMGALASEASLSAASDQAVAAYAEDDMLEFFVEDAFDSDITSFDFEEGSGTDALLFSNGVGDGGFPMSRGLDTHGDIASLVVWSLSYPWRLAITDGTPPQDVTDREEEILECMRGERAVAYTDDWSHCTTDP